MPDPRSTQLARAIRSAAERVPPVTLDEVLARPRLDIPDLGRDHADDGDHAAEEPPGTGGTHMVIELQERRVGGDDAPEADEGPGRSRWAVAVAAAAVLALAGIGVGVLADGGDDRVDVAPAAEDDETPPAAEDGPGPVLDRFIRAVNERDEASMIEFLDGGMVNGHLVDPAYLAAGDRWTRTGPCRPAGAEEFLCTVRREDDLHGAAGLALELDLATATGESGLLDKLIARGDDPYRAYVAFRHAFRVWVDANHPEADLRFYPSEPNGSPDTADLPEAGSMPAALELVDDFVDQSDEYPVG